MPGLYAELLILRRRTANWVLLGVAILVTALFGYILPYGSYLSDPAAERSGADLQRLLPGQALASVLEGFPFYLGVLGLVLGGLAFGSEFQWGTLKTTLISRPNRLRLFVAKIGAIGVALVVATLAVFAVGLLASGIVLAAEGESLNLPSPWEITRSLGAGWLILALWATLGAFLAVLFRGTTLPVSLGIIWGFMVEGLISAFGESIGLLGEVSRLFLRANGYSLVSELGVAVPEDGEPGFYSGPFVDAWQALVVISVYIVLFAGAAAMLLRRRDIT